MQSTKAPAQFKCNVPLRSCSADSIQVKYNSGTIQMQRSTQDLLCRPCALKPSLAATPAGSRKPGAQANISAHFLFRPSRGLNSVLISELPFQYQLLLPSLTLEEPATAQDVRVQRAYAPRFPHPPGLIPRRPADRRALSAGTRPRRGRSPSPKGVSGLSSSVR